MQEYTDDKKIIDQILSIKKDLGERLEGRVGRCMGHLTR